MNSDDAEKVLSKYPNYVPCFIKCDPSLTSKKTKFLLPRDECWSYAIANIRKHIDCKPSEALFFMVDGKIIAGSGNIGTFYSGYVKSRKGKVVIIEVFKEKAFGSVIE